MLQTSNNNRERQTNGIGTVAGNVSMIEREREATLNRLSKQARRTGTSGGKYVSKHQPARKLSDVHFARFSGGHGPVINKSICTFKFETG